MSAIIVAGKLPCSWSWERAFKQQSVVHGDFNELLQTRQNEKKKE